MFNFLISNNYIFPNFFANFSVSFNKHSTSLIPFFQKIKKNTLFFRILKTKKIYLSENS